MLTLDTTKPPMRALLLENIHPDATALLTKAGYEVETRKGALNEDELIDALPGFSLLGIRSRTHMTERALAAGAGPGRDRRVLHRRQPDRPRCRVVPRRRGVQRAVLQHPQCRRAGGLGDHRADPAAATRTAKMHPGEWDKSASGSHEVRGRRLGIVGYGNIGGQLSVLAETLGMSVYFYDTADKLALGNARRCGTLDELLEASTSCRCTSTAGPATAICSAARIPNDAARAAFSSISPAVSWSTTCVASNASCPAISPALPSTCSRPSRGRGARSSCPICAACRTSS